MSPLAAGRGLGPHSAPKSARAASTKKPAVAPKPGTEKKSDGKAGRGAAARPAALAEPRGGKADDLKMIKGVGPKLERLLHSMGFYHFDQVANWTGRQIAWVDENLKGFKGRVTRDHWVAQAKRLASGQETEFSKRAKY